MPKNENFEDIIFGISPKKVSKPISMLSKELLKKAKYDERLELNTEIQNEYKVTSAKSSPA